MNFDILVTELVADPIGIVPPFVLMAFLFWSVNNVTDSKSDENRKAKIASIVILIAIIQGVIGVFVQITIGLPPMYTLTIIAYCLMSMPMMAQIILFAPKSNRREDEKDGENI